jgi:hypothetical protein
MDSFPRLRSAFFAGSVRVLGFALLFLVAGAAYAEGTVSPANTLWRSPQDPQYYTNTASASPSLAAAVVLSQWSPVCNGGCTGKRFSCSGATCTFYVTSGSTGTEANAGSQTMVQIAGGCPASSTAAGGQCTCNSGFSPNSAATACVASSGSSSCQALVDGANYLGIDGTFTAVAPPGSTQFCSGGCLINSTGGTFYRDAGAWKGQFYGPFTLVGSSCSSQPVAGEPAPAPCPAGQAPGTVNGVTSCYPAGSTSTTSTSSTADGSGAVTGTTTTTTTQTGGSVTTTTTTRNGAGQVTGTTTDTKPADRFCVQNPDTTICQKTSFGGSCLAGFTCSGDAVYCAMAREQHLRNCEVFAATGTTRTVGADAIARGDTRASDHPGAAANVVNVGNGASGFDQTDIISGGGCPADQVIAVASGSVTMPWSQLCTPAAWLGNLLVGLTALACAFVAFKQG